MPEFEAGNFTVGTLVGLIIGALIGHVLAIRRGKIQSRHNAAVELKKEFRHSVLQLESGESPTIIISPDVYHRHYKAAIDFSATLEGRKLRNFNVAVNEYAKWYRGVCDRNIAERMYGNDDPEYIRLKDTNPLKLIDNILKHANT